MDKCSTINDAWRIFEELHGSGYPSKTKNELHDYIHERGLLFEELDENFWEECIEWAWK